MKKLTSVKLTPQKTEEDTCSCGKSLSQCSCEDGKEEGCGCGHCSC